MNNERRKEIDRLMERVNSLLSDLSEIKDSIENVRDEEQEYLDNLPENMVDGERAEKAQAAIDAIEEALGSLDDSETSLEGINTSLETAKE